MTCSTAADRISGTPHPLGNPVPDATAVAAAQALLVRVSERVARIRGTDAPRRSITLTGQPGPEEILAFIEHANPEDMAAAVAMKRRRIEKAAAAADLEETTRTIAGSIEA